MADTIAMKGQKSDLLLTGVGNSFHQKVQQSFKKHNPKIKRVVYYENINSYVPSYSKEAAKTIKIAEEVWFANSSLCKEGINHSPNRPIDLTHKKVTGIGYFDIKTSQSIRQKRA